MEPRRRLLLIGIDSATLRLVRPWAERGDLPALGRLMRSGARGLLWSVPNMITPAAWTTFATGSNPGRHGIFFFTERVPGSYRERPVQGASRALPPFWTLLGNAGVRCTVVGVPMTYPADALNGVMVSGMDAPGADAPGFTHPPGLAREIVERFGDIVGKGSLSGAIGHLMLAGRADEACDVLERRVRVRTELARYLMEHHPTELFALVHTEVDGAQHYFWHRLNASRGQDGILRLYRAVDRSIETLLEAFGPSNVMIVSDHGAGASPGVEDGVPWIRLVLEERGLAVSRHAPPGLRGTAKSLLATAYRTLNPHLPIPARRALNRMLPAAKQAVRASVRHEYDWARTKAFCSGAAGDIWLNVAGRDPEGTVTGGREYEQLRAEIRDAFLALRDSVTGEPVVEAVHFREQVYDGPFVSRAPDLFILFRDTVINGLTMDGKTLHLPRRKAAVPKDLKSGSHRPDGMIVLAGEGIRPQADLRNARLLDVAPTVLYWMGQPIPPHMDGAVLDQAFSDDFRRAHPAAVAAPLGAPGEQHVDSPYSDEDEAILLERLRGLGYV